MMICSRNLRAEIEKRIAQTQEAKKHAEWCARELALCNGALNAYEAALLDITRAEVRVQRAGSIGLAAVHDELQAVIRELDAMAAA